MPLVALHQILFAFYGKKEVADAEGKNRELILSYLKRKKIVCKKMNILSIFINSKKCVEKYKFILWFSPILHSRAESSWGFHFMQWNNSLRGDYNSNNFLSLEALASNLALIKEIILTQSCDWKTVPIFLQSLNRFVQAVSRQALPIKKNILGRFSGF